MLRKDMKCSSLVVQRTHHVTRIQHAHNSCCCGATAVAALPVLLLWSYRYRYTVSNTAALFNNLTQIAEFVESFGLVETQLELAEVVATE
jgi:ADP-ribosylglycohydrolase